MNLVTQLFAIVAVLFGVVAFVLELPVPSAECADLSARQAGTVAWRTHLGVQPGVYNLFLAAGPAAGLIAQYAGNQSVGRALVIYGCAFMAACGVVLFISDRRLWRSMIGQSGPPLIALIAAFV